MGTTTLPSNKFHYEINLTHIRFPSRPSTSLFLTMKLQSSGKLTRVIFLSRKTTMTFITTTLHMNER